MNVNTSGNDNTEYNPDPSCILETKISAYQAFDKSNLHRIKGTKVNYLNESKAEIARYVIGKRL